MKINKSYALASVGFWLVSLYSIYVTQHTNSRLSWLVGLVFILSAIYFWRKAQST